MPFLEFLQVIILACQVNAAGGQNDYKWPEIQHEQQKCVQELLKCSSDSYFPNRPSKLEQCLLKL
jgi:hypothetical protein